MKRIAGLLGILMMMSACAPDNDIKGKEFKMANEPITIGFDKSEKRFHGKAVNRFSGTYEAAGESIKFGPAMSTMMAGEPSLMKAESNFLKDLPKIRKYTLTEGKLTFTKEDGKEIVFEDITK